MSKLHTVKHTHTQFQYNLLKCKFPVFPCGVVADSRGYGIHREKELYPQRPESCQCPGVRESDL